MCFPISVKDKVPTSWLYIIWKARACNILTRHLILFWTNVKFSIRLSAVQVTRVSPLSPWMRATLRLGPRASGRSRQGGQCRRGRTAQCRGAREPSSPHPQYKQKQAHSAPVNLQVLPFSNLFQRAGYPGQKARLLFSGIAFPSSTK